MYLKILKQILFKHFQFIRFLFWFSMIQPSRMWPDQRDAKLPENRGRSRGNTKQLAFDRLRLVHIQSGDWGQRFQHECPLRRHSHRQDDSSHGLALRRQTVRLHHQLGLAKHLPSAGEWVLPDIRLDVYHPTRFTW